MDTLLSVRLVPVLLDVLLITALLMGVFSSEVSRRWRYGLVGLVVAMSLHLAESFIDTDLIEVSPLAEPVLRTLAVLGLIVVAWFLRESAADQKRLSDWVERHRRHAEGEIDDAPFAMLNLRADGTIRLLNQYAAHLLEPDEDTRVEGVDFFERFVPPADRTRAREAFDEFISSGGTWPTFAEHPLMTPSGTRVLRWTRMAILDQNGRVDEVVAYGEDVTRLREAEHGLERYLALAEHTRDIILFVRASDGRIVEANRAAEQSYGYPRQELLCLSVADLRALSPTDEVRAQLDAARTDGATFETLHVRANGTPFPVEVNSQAVTSENGETILLSLIRDISDRRHREFELDEYRRRLRSLAQRLQETQAQERRTLASELHDRVSQPLAAARLKLGLAARKHAEISGVTEISEAQSLIGEAIAESRAITSEMSPPLLYDVGLAAALEWLASEQERRYGLHCELHTEITDVEDEDVKTFLFKAARELLMNAAKHSGATTATMSLRAVGDDLELVVRDEGRGFDTDRVSKPSGDERGFGLFNLAESAAHLHAMADVRSKVGAGTTVTVRVAPPAARTAGGPRETQ